MEGEGKGVGVIFFLSGFSEREEGVSCPVGCPFWWSFRATLAVVPPKPPIASGYSAVLSAFG